MCPGSPPPPEHVRRLSFRRFRTGAVRATLLCCLFGAGYGHAGLAPENVVVLVNSRSWISRSVANAYIRRRDIPAINVILLDNITSLDGIDIESFRKTILKPTLAIIERRRLTRHVSCIVYAPDFPTWVDFSGDLNSGKPPRLVGSKASITGLTFLYQDVLARNPGYTHPLANWYARKPLNDTFRPPTFTPEESRAYAEVTQLFVERKKRQSQNRKQKKSPADTETDDGWPRILALLTPLAAAHPEAADVVYNLACAQCRNGMLAEAVKTLRTLEPIGYRYARHIAEDEDLAPLRHRPDFQALLRRFRSAPVRMNPPRPFPPAVGWTPRGVAVAPYKGARYMLSVMLGVTNGRGNSYEEVISGLNRAADADDTRPPGTIYFMENTNIRSTCRQWAVPSALADVEAHGVQGEMLPGKLPMNRPDVAGLFTGTASFSWKKSGSRILPGAICDHLTSFGGVMAEHAGQTPLSEFIRYGAAGASGTVCEPFASQAKFPTAFIQSYYTEGYSLAEAFYLSVASPYQLLIVGDPLCAPWARHEPLAIVGLTPGKRVADTQFSIFVKNTNADGSHPPVETTWLMDGMFIGTTRGEHPLTCHTERIGPGWHTLRALSRRGPGPGTVQRTIVPFVVGGEQADFRLAKAPVSTVPWTGTLHLQRIPERKGILVLTWLGHEIARLNNTENEIEVPARNLALGPVRLQPFLEIADGTRLQGVPIDVNITPPAPISPTLAGMATDAMPEGLHVLRGQALVLVADKATGPWLQKAGFGKDEAVTIDAWFEVREPSLAQFQFKGNLPLENAVRIDGQPQIVPGEGSGWRSFPLVLKAGTHRLTIQSRCPDKPRLDIRYGVQGTQTVTGKHFRHP